MRSKIQARAQITLKKEEENMKKYSQKRLAKGFKSFRGVAMESSTSQIGLTPTLSNNLLNSKDQKEVKYISESSHTRTTPLGLVIPKWLIWWTNLPSIKLKVGFIHSLLQLIISENSLLWSKFGLNAETSTKLKLLWFVPGATTTECITNCALQGLKWVNRKSHELVTLRLVKDSLAWCKDLLVNVKLLRCLDVSKGDGVRLECFKSRQKGFELRRRGWTVVVDKDDDTDIGTLWAAQRLSSCFRHLLLSQFNEICDLNLLRCRVSKVAHELGQLVDFQFTFILFSYIILWVSQSHDRWEGCDSKSLD